MHLYITIVHIVNCCLCICNLTASTEFYLRTYHGFICSVFQELGSGEFGVVHLGTWTDVCSDPVQVAVKTLNSQCSESDRIKFLREAAIMGQFKHDNVVQLHGVVTEEENMMIVLEFMPKGDLQEFLIKLKNTCICCYSIKPLLAN